MKDTLKLVAQYIAVVIGGVAAIAIFAAMMLFVTNLANKLSVDEKCGSVSTKDGAQAVAMKEAA